MKLEDIKVDKRVGYESRAYVGTGKVAAILTEGKRGAFVHVIDIEHPRGSIKVRPNQIVSEKRGQELKRAAKAAG